MLCTVALRALAAIALVAYPLLAWLGLSAGSPRQVALVLLAALLISFGLRSRGRARHAVRGLAAVPLTMLLLLTGAALLDLDDCILLTPVATNAALLVSFGLTLRRGSMPMIERFARLQEPDLDRDQRAWCRLWTWIWCAFFVANGAAAAAFAVWAQLEWWALYNGMICYGLIGTLFAVEWLLRRRRFPATRPQPESHDR